MFERACDQCLREPGTNVEFADRDRWRLFYNVRHDVQETSPDMRCFVGTLMKASPFILPASGFLMNSTPSFSNLWIPQWPQTGYSRWPDTGLLHTGHGQPDVTKSPRVRVTRVVGGRASLGGTDDWGCRRGSVWESDISQNEVYSKIFRWKEGFTK